MKTFRLAILISHPIQYYAPLFKMMATDKSLALKVFYSLGENERLLDQGFGKIIKWDLPLLDGYEYEFLKNTADKKGSHHFMGIKNNDVTDKITAFLPDAILIYGWSYHSHLKAMRYFKGKIPVWFRGDSTLIDRLSLWKKITRSLLLRWVYNHIDIAFFVGKHNKEYYEAFGLNENQLVFAPHAVDNERFGKDKTNEALLLRRELAIPDEGILILFAGKFEDKKDPLLLLDAFKKLNKANTHLLFVGNGELEERLKRSANLVNPLPAPSKGGQNFPVEKSVHFMDFKNQSQMPVIYQACDLFCLPSKGPNETWGLSVNEAMASGKAVLVSDKVGCAIDLIEDGKNGYIFNSNNLNDLVRKIDGLTSNRDTLKNMGLYSLEMIKKWSFEKQLEKIIKEIKSA